MKKIIFSFILLFSFSIQVEAQKVRPSQKASIAQSIANTEIQIEYSRPVARGRTLFGEDGIVKYDKVWMPGANEATFIEISTPVLVNGQELASGKYSIWSVPGEDYWELIFSSKWDAWHSEYPGEDSDVLRVQATSKQGDHMEVMAFYFPVVSSNSAILNLHWGSTIVELNVALKE